MRKYVIALFFFAVFSGCRYNRDEGFIYFRLRSNPTTLDPAYVVDVPGGRLSAKLFNGLVKIDENLDVIPDIASGWDISPDGKIYTFYLKKDVRFSNGRTVKADDFIYSFRRILDPKNRCPNKWVLEKIKGAFRFKERKADSTAGLKAVDEYTLRIVLERPFSPFLSLLSMPAAYVVPEEEISKRGDTFGFNPVGTGPYILKRWTPNDELVFEARKDYFERAPTVKGLVYRIIPEDLTGVTEFELGNIDVMDLPVSAYGYYTKNPERRKRVFFREGLNTYYIGFNCRKYPFNKKRLRQAAGYAVDVKRVLRTIYAGRGRPASGPVPSGLREWPVMFPYHYNPEKARELLKSSGTDVPVKADFYITSDRSIVDIAEVIQSYLNAAGFSVHIKQLEWSAYKEALNRGDADIFYLSWWADYPDPENFLYPLFHSSNMGPAGNRTRYKNSRVDELIVKGQSAVDRRRRNMLYREAERIIIDDAPWIPLWHRKDYLLKQSWITMPSVPLIYSSDKGVDILLSEPAGAKYRDQKPDSE